MDQAGQQAAREFKMSWDREKDWKNSTHLGVNLDSRKHWKYRTAKARGAWQMVRRLTRLPPKEKKIVPQLLLILTYGGELHHIPTKEAQALAAEMNRFVVGAWRGSSNERVAAIAGIAELVEAMKRKRVRWTASVYARGAHLQEVEALREIAEEILRENTGGEAMLIQPEKGSQHSRGRHLQ